jgi:hypothetical protein
MSVFAITELLKVTPSIGMDTLRIPKYEGSSGSGMLDKFD